MSKTIELAAALLRSEVRGEGSREGRLPACTQEELRDALELAGRHDLSHVAAEAARKLNLPLDETLREAERANARKAVWRVERQDRELARICAELESAGIDHLPLKGAVIRAHYPQVWMRTSCDIDLLVRPEDADRAAKQLEQALGYQNEGRVYHDISLRSPGGIHIELHFSLNANMAQADRKLAEVWEWAAPVAGHPRRYEMTPDFLLFYIVAHMAGHFLRGGCGIRSILDLWLLERDLPGAECDMRTHLEDSGLLPFYEGVHRLSLVWFSGKPADNLTERLAEYIAVGGIYGTQDNRIVVSQSRRKGKLGYWLGRFFLSREVLQGVYPQLAERPWLYPYYQVKRWLRGLNRNTRGRIAREFQKGQGISEEKRAETEELLSDLNLLKPE